MGCCGRFDVRLADAIFHVQSVEGIDDIGELQRRVSVCCDVIEPKRAARIAMARGIGEL